MLDSITETISTRGHMKLSATHMDRARSLMGYRFPPLGRAAFDWFFRSVPRHMDAQLFPGVNVPLDFRDETQRSTYWQGVRFDHPIAPFLADHGRHATAFFDIGANYGFFSYWMLSQCRNVQVYAFDPVPSNIACLEEVRKRNLLDSRFHVIGQALGNTQEVRCLRLGSEDSGHSTFGVHTGLTGASVEVAVVPFDLWRERVGLQLPDTPQWVAKIDVEGFELNVLQGMEKSLRKQAFSGLVVEVNEYTLKLFDVSPSDLFAFLHECGYVTVDPGSAKGTPSASCYNAFFTPSGKRTDSGPDEFAKGHGKAGHGTA